MCDITLGLGNSQGPLIETDSYSSPEFTFIEIVCSPFHKPKGNVLSTSETDTGWAQQRDLVSSNMIGWKIDTWAYQP